MENDDNKSGMGENPMPENLGSQSEPIINQPEVQSSEQPIDQPMAQLQERTMDQSSDLLEQPVSPMQPTDQSLAPQMQPIDHLINQPATSSLNMGSPAINSKEKNKKTGIIIGSIIGCVLVIIAVVILVIFLMKNNEKTVSCTSSMEMYGIDMSNKTEVIVGSGAILSGSIVVNVNFKNINEMYADYEKNIVDSVMDEYKYQCKDYCSFDHEYVEKDHLTLTLKYNKEGIDNLVVTSGIEGKSAQEIADKIQKNLEETGATCEQH